MRRGRRVFVPLPDGFSRRRSFFQFLRRLFGLRRGRGRGRLRLPLPRGLDGDFPGSLVFLERGPLVLFRQSRQFIGGRKVYAVCFQFFFELRGQVANNGVIPPNLRRAGMKHFCDKIAGSVRLNLAVPEHGFDNPLQDGHEPRAGLCLFQHVPQVAHFLDLVPRRFLPLGVGDNQVQAVPDFLIFRRFLVRLHGTGDEFILRLSIFHKGQRREAAAVARNDFVFPAVQRNDGQVLQNFPGDLDCRFQFFNLPHGIEIIFRRHKVKDADFLNLAFSGAGRVVPALRRLPRRIVQNLIQIEFSHDVRPFLSESDGLSVYANSSGTCNQFERFPAPVRVPATGPESRSAKAFVRHVVHVQPITNPALIRPYFPVFAILRGQLLFLHAFPLCKYSRTKAI